MRKNTSLLSLSFVLIFSFAFLTACEKKSELKVGITKVVSITPNGCVASLWATRTSEETVQKRADKHINGDITPSQINTELMKAVVRNQLKKVESLLGAGVDPEETNERGCTALIWATALNRHEIAAKLISAGADVSQADATGKTPLMMGSKAGNQEIVRQLVVNGANVNTAQIGGSNEIGQTALHHAVSRPRNLEVIHFLIERGAKVDAKNEHGRTPLIKAAQSGNLENVKLLVELGADISIKTDRGKTALASAKAWNKADVVIYLESLK